MLFITRWFGVTGSDADRNFAREQSDIEQIVELSLLMQKNAAEKQHRPLGRGTHVKGVSAQAQFEVFDVTAGRDSGLAIRLAKGMFAKPGVYPAIVRFGNADPSKNSDFKADVRSLSFSVDLTRNGTAATAAKASRQDFSMQNTKTLPINDSPAFLAIMKFLTASKPGVRLVGAFIQGQVESVEDNDTGAISASSSHQTVSATSLWKQCTVSLRTDRRCQAMRNAVAGQSGAAPAEE